MAQQAKAPREITTKLTIVSLVVILSVEVSGEFCGSIERNPLSVVLCGGVTSAKDVRLTRVISLYINREAFRASHTSGFDFDGGHVFGTLQQKLNLRGASRLLVL